MIDVIKPTLLLNKEKSLNNIKNIQKNLTDSKIELRPHFKTHQSNVVGNWFKELGIKKITVSSVTMAKYFSKYWDDITIAFPVNILELDDVIMLQEKIKINLLVDSYDVLEILEKKLRNSIENPNIFQDLVKNGLESSKRFTDEDVGKKWKKLIEKLTNI